MQETFLVSEQTETKSVIIQALDSVKDALEEKIFDDSVEVNDEKINENLAILNNNRIEKIKEEKKSLGVKFDSKDAQNMFSTFTDLLEIVKNSGIKTDEVAETVKDIMSAQMEKDNKKANNAPNLDD